MLAALARSYLEDSEAMVSEVEVEERQGRCGAQAGERERERGR